MSMWYCNHCDRAVDTNAMDHCEWGSAEDPDHFKCDDCVDRDEDPTPDEEGEPPVTMAERQVAPR